MKDWQGSPHANVVIDAMKVAGIDHVAAWQVNFVLNAADAAGLLLTPERLDEMARRIEIEADRHAAKPGIRDGYLAAAAMVRWTQVKR